MGFRRRVLSALCVWAICGGPVEAGADACCEGETRLHPAPERDAYPYLLFVPHGYAAAPGRVWPLVIDLHDAGGFGGDAERLRRSGAAKVFATRGDLPALLVAPHGPEADRTWDLERLERLLAHLRRTYRIDPARISLTGASVGGAATWKWLMRRPDLFAAGMPVGGHEAITTPEAGTEICRLKNLPILVTLIEAPIVPGEGIFAVLSSHARCAGGTRQARGNLPSGATPSARIRAAYEDGRRWEWLLRQRRAGID